MFDRYDRFITPLLLCEKDDLFSFPLLLCNGIFSLLKIHYYFIGTVRCGAGKIIIKIISKIPPGSTLVCYFLTGIFVTPATIQREKQILLSADHLNSYLI